MALRFRRHIRACGDGTLEVRLGAAERALLSEVADDLARNLDQPDDLSLQRLFPPGYSEDAVRDAGYQMMMGDELRQHHLDAVRSLAATTGADRLDPAQAESWLRSINAVRLVLGTRLGVTDDQQTVHLRRGDPNLRSWVAYDFLSTLLDDLVTAMSF
jgi:hypothetical protein